MIKMEQFKYYGPKYSECVKELAENYGFYN